jgi:methylenetetrahydrofolate reductase (NADPH)
MDEKAFTASDIYFSLEVFPPRTEGGRDHLLATIDAYAKLNPSAVTVTFGTGTATETVESSRLVVRLVHERLNKPVAAHLTCAGRTKVELDGILDAFWHDGVRHIVALRGDMLQGTAYKPLPDGYPMTQDFIAGIKTRYPQMKVLVAGYPETHPESPSETFDLDHLKHKVDAGADGILTQFFFDPDVFLRWRDKVAAHGIQAPLTPGLLPILNFPRMVAMARKCNAHVPGFLHVMFEDVEPDTIDHKLLAMNVLSHQITRLIEHGVKNFHFYTMNDTLLTKHLCTWLRAGF